MIEKLEINVANTKHITNCYIFSDESTNEAVVIDPADNAQLIIERINKLCLKLKYIMLTHAHRDHTNALLDLLNKYNDVKVIVSKHEVQMLSGTVDDCSGVFDLAKQKYDFNRFIFLSDEDIINVGNTAIKHINTPGHSSGSSCFYIKEEGILFTGDTLFSNSFGRCDLETGSIEDMANSLCRIYINYSNVKIYPGHGVSSVLIEDTYKSVRNMLLYSTFIDLDKLLNKGDNNE